MWKVKALWIYKNALQNAIKPRCHFTKWKQKRERERTIRYAHYHHQIISCLTSVAKDIRDNFCTVLAHTRRTCKHRRCLYIYVHFNYYKFFDITIELYDRFRVKVYMAFSAVNNKMLSKLFSRDIQFYHIFCIFSNLTFMYPDVLVRWNPLINFFINLYYLNKKRRGNFI